ncbi:MAG: hypothetical protein ACREN8_11525 [Candidatus Dormibacteraceae bacterium]
MWFNGEQATCDQLAGRGAASFGAARVIAVGALLMAVGSAALLGAGPTTPYAALVVQLCALGFGIGLIVPPMTSSLLGSMDRSRSGIASGTLNTARQSGSVIGTALFGSLIAGTGRFVPGLHLALAISMGLVIAVAVFTLGIERETAS